MIDMLTAMVIFCICTAYLLGSINTSIIVSKLKGADIRNHGSGNAGATNTLRVMGKGAAAAVVLFDAAKGVAAVLFAKYAPRIFNVEDSASAAMYLSALAVIAGHIYPIYFGFKGGKGVMTSIAVVFVLDWEIGVILLVTCIAIMLLTRYVSLGSCIGAVLLPVLVIMFHEENGLFVAVSVAIGLLILLKHRANISRLIRGTESRLSFK